MIQQFVRWVIGLGLFVGVQSFAADVHATSPADWPMYNHDPAGWRFNSAEKTPSPVNIGTIVEK